LLQWCRSVLSRQNGRQSMDQIIASCSDVGGEEEEEGGGGFANDTLEPLQVENDANDMAMLDDGNEDHEDDDDDDDGEDDDDDDEVVVPQIRDIMLCTMDSKGSFVNSVNTRADVNGQNDQDDKDSLALLKPTMMVMNSLGDVMVYVIAETEVNKTDSRKLQQSHDSSVKDVNETGDTWRAVYNIDNDENDDEYDDENDSEDDDIYEEKVAARQEKLRGRNSSVESPKRFNRVRMDIVTRSPFEFHSTEDVSATEQFQPNLFSRWSLSASSSSSNSSQKYAVLVRTLVPFVVSATRGYIGIVPYQVLSSIANTPTMQARQKDAIIPALMMETSPLSFNGSLVTSAVGIKIKDNQSTISLLVPPPPSPAVKSKNKDQLDIGSIPHWFKTRSKSLGVTTLAVVPLKPK
jgi:hypothetical protein